MANDQSEEKTLPASKKKLADARRKGQVARSKDLVSGISLAGALGLLAFGGAGAAGAAIAMFNEAGEVAAGDFATGLGAMAAALSASARRIVLPFYLLIPLLIVLSAMVMLRGIPFAFDPITPKADNINPVEGLKRLFKLKSLIELVKSLVKMLLLGTAVVLVLASGLQTLVLLPACGMACVPGAVRGIALPLLGAAAGLFLVVGLADAGLQHWLFLREQKMGITEARRERKDMDGDPLVKRERRRLLREAVRMPGGLGMRRATLVVHDGQRMAVGLRFRLNETPVPLVVCRGSGDRGTALLDEAARRDVPMVEDNELALSLFRRAAPGVVIPEDTYKAVAQALARAKLV
jgi:type III secretion protein U